MKNRKWIILLAIIILCSVGSYNLYQKYMTTYGTWEVNWGFEVPKPTKMTTVFEEGAFDWHAYIIAEYNERTFEKVKELELWEPMNDEKMFRIVTERVELFKKQIVQMIPEYAKAFEEHPIEFDENSLWYLSEHEGGSYFIAILNTSNKKVYTMELTF